MCDSLIKYLILFKLFITKEFLMGTVTPKAQLQSSQLRDFKSFVSEELEEPISQATGQQTYWIRYF